MIGVGGSDWKHYVRRNPHVVKRRIRKGIPDCLRGLVWQLISGSRDLLLMNPGVYEVLIRVFFSCILCHYIYDCDLHSYTRLGNRGTSEQDMKWPTCIIGK